MFTDVLRDPVQGKFVTVSQLPQIMTMVVTRVMHARLNRFYTPRRTFDINF